MRIKNAPLVHIILHQGGVFMKPADQNRLICGRNKLFPYFLQARARGGRIVPEVKQGVLNMFLYLSASCAFAFFFLNNDIFLRPFNNIWRALTYYDGKDRRSVCTKRIVF